jgi:hypothetical protein
MWCDGWKMQCVWQGSEVGEHFWQQNQKENRSLGKLSLEDNFKMDLNKEGGRLWTGFKWLGIGSSGRIV